MKINIRSFAIFLTCFLAENFMAQDIHWSQPSNALIYQNPSFTGIDSRYNLGINYRDQWNIVNKSYKTFMATGDYRFDKYTSENTNLSLGGIVTSDASADGSYITSGGGLTLSCMLKVNPFVKIGAGIGFGIFQSSIADHFTWGNQYDGQNYNSALATGEDKIGLRKNYSDLNAGIAYIYNRNVSTVNGNDNMKWIIGYSMNHINRPNIAVNGDKDALNIKNVATIVGLVPIRDNFSLRPTILFYSQGGMNELTAGGLARYTLGQTSKITGIKKGMFFSIGALYRIKDAVIPTAEFQKSNFIIAMSYDLTASKFTSATQLRGGFEISLRLIAPGDYLYIGKEQPKNSKTKKNDKPSL